MKKISRKLCKHVTPLALRDHERRVGKINTRVNRAVSLLAFLKELPR